jgi:hypothetical protein
MRGIITKILPITLLCVASATAFGASYNCKYQDERSLNLVKEGLRNNNGKYLYCGHVGTDGCSNGNVVFWERSGNGYLEKCVGHSWEGVRSSEIPTCKDNDTQLPNKFIDNNLVIYYEKDAGSEKLTQYCKIDTVTAEHKCSMSGGNWNFKTNVCTCSGNLKKNGELDTSPCKCASDDFEYNVDLNGKNPACWPKSYLDGKCLQYGTNSDGYEVWYCPGYFKGVIFRYDFQPLSNKDCEFKDWINDRRICNNNGKIEWRGHIGCSGVSFQSAKAAYDSDNFELGRDVADCYCLKPTKQNKSGSMVKPKSQQQKSPGESAPATVKSAQVPVIDTVASLSNDSESGTQTCSDTNMDANCECTKVPETTKRNNRCECINVNKVIKNGKCEWTTEYIASMQSNVDNNYDSLHAIMSGFETSVWKNAEGKFNTARLASDSIAGVVLGTVGGIVTANIVKKAQVKQGFEDMKCSIGGQSVANFGDEFTVGW